jgi:hypothetical protein
MNTRTAVLAVSAASFTVIGGAIAAVVLLWSDGSSGGTVALFTPIVRQYQSQLDFTPLAPDYLPAGTCRTPHGSVDGGTLTIYLQLCSQPDSPPEDAAYISIDEAKGAVSAFPAVIFGGQTETSATTSAGKDVSIFRETSGGQVFENFRFVDGETAISLTVMWSSDGSGKDITLSGAMEKEALKVLQSMSKVS